MCTGMEVLALSAAAGSAGGQLGAGNAEAEALEYNADVAKAQGENAQYLGAEEERRVRRDVRMLIGAQRSGYAGQGVVVSSGSALEMQMDTARLGEEDILRIRNNTANEVWGYEVEEYNYKYGAKVAKYTATVGAVTTLAGGIAKAGPFTFPGDKTGPGNHAHQIGGSAKQGPSPYTEYHPNSYMPGTFS
jgi:hypothetical protein